MKLLLNSQWKGKSNRLLKLELKVKINSYSNNMFVLLVAQCSVYSSTEH